MILFFWLFWLFAILFLVTTWVIYHECNKQPEEVKTTNYSEPFPNPPYEDNWLRNYEKDLKLLQSKTQEPKMTIHEFSIKVAKLEGKKKQVSIAQIKEVLKVANKLTDGKLYTIIRKS